MSAGVKGEHCVPSMEVSAGGGKLMYLVCCSFSFINVGSGFHCLRSFSFSSGQLETNLARCPGFCSELRDLQIYNITSFYDSLVAAHIS